ncbi:hypothetical protein R1flu_012895 [Riccia fluitans]|uniref:Uncharacterized protein n=1 Tax=Riccia fluitans TaxID=41844 RepID=A0ABD1ZC61_9MARC
MLNAVMNSSVDHTLRIVGQPMLIAREEDRSALFDPGLEFNGWRVRAFEAMQGLNISSIYENLPPARRRAAGRGSSSSFGTGPPNSHSLASIPRRLETTAREKEFATFAAK